MSVCCSFIAEKRRPVSSFMLFSSRSCFLFFALLEEVVFRSPSFLFCVARRSLNCRNLGFLQTRSGCARSKGGSSCLAACCAESTTLRGTRNTEDMTQDGLRMPSAIKAPPATADAPVDDDPLHHLDENADDQRYCHHAECVSQEHHLAIHLSVSAVIVCQLLILLSSLPPISPKQILVAATRLCERYADQVCIYWDGCSLTMSAKFTVQRCMLDASGFCCAHRWQQMLS